MNAIVEWAKKNPALAGGVAFFIGLFVLYILGFFSGGSSGGSSDNSAADAAYYAAESAQAQAGDQLQETQIAAQASTAQDLINATAGVTNNTTWANTDLSETQLNNQAATDLAPYATEDNLISTLGQIAALPENATTTTNKSNGFFGIGGGSSTSTVVSPNPSSVTADQLLSELTTNGLHAGN